MLKRYGQQRGHRQADPLQPVVIYVNQGDYAKGEAELEALLEQHPDDPGVNNDLGYLYADQGKNLEKAEAMIRKAVQEEPENCAYLDSLGWVLFKRGKVKEALEPLEKAVELQQTERRARAPDATILEHLGDVYFQLQEIDEGQGSPGRRPRRPPPRPSRPTSACPRSARSSNRSSSSARSPKPRRGDTP